MKRLFKNSIWKQIKWGLLAIAVLILSLLLTPPSIVANPFPSSAIALEQQGKTLYQAGRYAEAAAILQQSLQVYQSQGDELEEAAISSNLALTYRQMGEIATAEEAIADSLEILQRIDAKGRDRILAQTLNIQASLELSKGQPEKAIALWKQVAEIYQVLGDKEGKIRTQIHQATAMQSAGLFRLALKTLETVKTQLETQPDSITKALGLRSLGDTLRLVGDLGKSQDSLNESLSVAKNLQSPQVLSNILLSLGNLARVQRNTDEALNFYQQVADLSPSPLTKTQAQLNQFSLLIEQENTQAARNLLPQINAEIEQLPLSRAAIYARINLSHSLMQLSPSEFAPTSARELAIATQQAQTLGDDRARAYALGYLGQVYEQTQQLDAALDLTQQALIVAQSIDAPDITYRWQWQLGRLLKATGGDRAGAISAYREAVNTLQTLRSELAAIQSEVTHSDLQFSFRESVEPVYRELVSLLLEPKEGTASPADIEQARKTIESLQLAELDNFFRSACLNAKPVNVDRIDRKAAIFYPIILSDRLEVILSLPGQSLTHYATQLPKKTVNRTVQSLRISLTQANRLSFRHNAKEVYEWLIRPIEEQLAQSQVETLVFIPDGVLRGIPMGALYDGEQFLIEKYAIAVAPGLELTDSGALQREEIRVLKAGVSLARQGFNALPGVEVELAEISDRVAGQVLLNENFTEATVQKAIDSAPFPIIHFATHGNFSSSAADTYILTWDDRINVNELSELLRTAGLGGSKAIELLVFSACETASGDRRAALGIAGVAVRAGARSTMASLWLVNDEATSELMQQFYSELLKEKVTKAEALRRAQITILKNPKYNGHPYFWAPFILVGNWL
ncbi:MULTISPECIES: CHAT domain-containing protein [Spirulina sp. CCY15215]|uniref:CHAT domain-containing protein n=1 Tax=Spirulina sp. CCY15215 TaxID=2767591 RepID=UPI00194E1750|nr:CHAT domain-containing protein [Spirulina major]